MEESCLVNFETSLLVRDGHLGRDFLGGPEDEISTFLRYIGYGDFGQGWENNMLHFNHIVMTIVFFENLELVPPTTAQQFEHSATLTLFASQYKSVKSIVCVSFCHSCTDWCVQIDGWSITLETMVITVIAINPVIPKLTYSKSHLLWHRRCYNTCCISSTMQPSSQGLARFTVGKTPSLCSKRKNVLEMKSIGTEILRHA